MAIGVQVTFDAADPARLAEFWALALGYVQQQPPEGFATWEDFLRARGVPEERWNDRNAVVDPEGKGPRLFFQRVPEGKVAKNRVHLDINAGVGARDDVERRRLVDEHVARLVAAGAEVLRVLDELGERCVVMRDPEGNEFCVQ
ncbi:MAG TPA: VOC family protein [Pseudonocardiaceae bacterium]